MNIGKLIRNSPVVLKKEQLLDKAVDLLIDHQQCAAPVVSGKKTIGVLLLAEALHRLRNKPDNKEQVVSDALFTDVTVLSPDDAIEDTVIGGLPFYPVSDSKGHYMGIVLVEDIYKDMKKIANRKNDVLQNAHNGILAVDAEGVIIVCNKSAGKHLGINPHEITGRKINEVFPTSRLTRVISTGKPESIQKIIVNGRSIVCNRTPIVYDGKVTGAVTVFQNVAELEAVSAELESVQRLYNELDTIVEAAHDGIMITNSDGIGLRVNRALCRLTGLEASYYLNQPIDKLYSDGVFKYESVTTKALREKRSVTAIQRINNGKEVLVTGTPIFSNNGELFRVVTNVRDIIELQKLKEERDRYIEKNSANGDVDDFIQQLRKGEIVAESTEMLKVLHVAVRVARAETTVLLLGESGVGKEVLAKIIHCSSNRPRRGKFIQINCGAIPESLLESELFGYESGAFTGAKKEGKPGLFEIADNGTLLLDEIGEMPQPLQVKLLRVLQEQEYYRIGGVKPIKLNVRIIAATNKDLKKLVKQGKFRKDLYYRLNVIPIEIPPLRHRKDDILPLSLHYLRNFNEKHQTNKTLDARTVAILESYHWPGNVRELMNILERTVILNSGDSIDPYIINNQLDQKGVKEITPIIVRSIIPLRKAQAIIERELLQKALTKNKTVRQAAKDLGISHSTLIRKAAQYNLKKENVITV
ncbi:sigma-54-dependent Fis family transcriptional regulator [Desulfoscipio gibsoniae]|uniref:HTH-type transcriptional regulatory protein TyrR n=1 Tax=Desulfoscipio gibsoniae DSM 7213 TaxID=767817 RepID=R4KGI7_9FIRM|nr:sigma-54-dependent Fis family transcriptional regulator [Desulfoscipio gibsoniae]AGL01714.1 PAS domain S-box [Desulfoscipio gibsoniae DSM 7213]